MKKLFVTLSVLFLSLTFSHHPALAVSTNPGGSDRMLLKDEIITTDYFSAGDKVTVSGVVEGDAYVAGSTVIVDGTIKGDLLVVGRSIEISGTILGDVRAAGESIVVTGSIVGNLTAGASTLELSEGSKLAGSLVGGAKDMVISTPIGKGITAGAGTLRIDQSVGGDLNYWSDQDVNLGKSATVSGVVTRHNLPKHEQPAVDRRAIARVFTGFSILSAIGFYLLAILILRLFPRYTENVITIMQQTPTSSIGKGLLFIMLSPLILFILMITIIGIPLSILGILTMVVVSSLAKVTVAFFLGRASLHIVSLKTNIYLELLVGMIITYILMAIPVLGWLATIIVFLMAVGSIVTHQQDLYHSLRTKKLL